MKGDTIVLLNYALVLQCVTSVFGGVAPVCPELDVRCSTPLYNNWSPPRTVHQVLYCPPICQKHNAIGTSSYDRCCSCKAKPSWELHTGLCARDLLDLTVEYIDVKRNSILLSEVDTNVSSYQAIHTHGLMGSMPRNICQRPNVVVIDFSFNNIRNLTTISCVSCLSVLKLDYNRIGLIGNGSFHELRFLRQLSLEGNGIHNVEPNFLSILQGAILNVNLAYNSLTSLDGIDMFVEGPFCKLNVSNNFLSELTNIAGFNFDMSSAYGPGTVDLGYTFVLPNFTTFGLTDYADIGKIIHGQFKCSGGQVPCDCSVYKLLLAVGANPEVFDIWPTLKTRDVVCSRPKSLAGTLVYNLTMSKDLDLVVCPTTENCPYRCSCTDQPNKDQMLVNCSGAGLTELPREMPTGVWNNNKLALLLGGNAIEKLDDREYLNRVKSIDLLGNSITSFVADTILKLSTDKFDGHGGNFPTSVKLSLTSNAMTRLPRAMFTLDPNLLEFPSGPIQCNCDNIWMADWFRLYGITGRIMCDLNGDQVPIETLTAKKLDCFGDKSYLLPKVGIPLGVVAASLLLVAAAIGFRYELFLLFGKLRREEQFATDNTALDVFISFEEENMEVFGCVSKIIRPRLQSLGYTVCAPFWDLKYGENREEQLRKFISDSRNFVVVLSRNYFDMETSGIQLSTLWNYYKWNSNRKLIFINFEMLKNREICDRKIRAFSRVNEMISFTDRETSMIDRLIAKIGPPRECPLTSKNDENDTDMVISEQKIIHSRPKPSQSHYKTDDTMPRDSKRWHLHNIDVVTDTEESDSEYIPEEDCSNFAFTSKATRLRRTAVAFRASSNTGPFANLPGQILNPATEPLSKTLKLYNVHTPMFRVIREKETDEGCMTENQAMVQDHHDKNTDTKGITLSDPTSTKESQVHEVYV